MKNVLVVVGVFAGLLVAGYFGYKMFFPSAMGGTEKAATEVADNPAASPTTTAAVANASHPLAKVIEVTGFRIQAGQSGRITVKAIVINHSGGPVADLKLNVALLRKGGDATPIAEVPMDVKKIAAQESRELTAQATTTLSALELPDWQFLQPKVTILSPEP